MKDNTLACEGGIEQGKSVKNRRTIMPNHCILSRIFLCSSETGRKYPSSGFRGNGQTLEGHRG